MMMNKRMLVIDIETNGLLDTMDKVHCAVAKDYLTGEVWEYAPTQIEEFARSLEGQTVIGHNIIAWLKFHTFRGDCKFSTWLTRIGINVVYKSMDKQKRRPPREDILVDSMDEHLYSDVFDFDTPELLSSLNQSQVIVAEAVDNMPTEQAEALTLREQDGLTYKQIADIMGSPVGTVQSRISRAKEHIRKHLEEAENESR